MRKKYNIQLGNRNLSLGERTLIMGILNVTPDSFSDGGRFANRDSAVLHAFEMIEDGADIIDIGGESTRPGADTVSADDELGRVLPVIKSIRAKSDIPISIDTYKSRIAREALDAGADIINDISGCRFDPEMPKLAAEKNAPVVVMHIKGTPKDMQKNPEYRDVVAEIKDYLSQSIELLTEAGLSREQIIIDPGIGFGKTTGHNLTIMKRLEEFAELDRPILMGASRKSVIGNVLDLPSDKRIFGTAACVTANIMRGTHIVRVHDVGEMRQVVRMVDAIISVIGQ